MAGRSLVGFQVQQLQLPLKGTKAEKDISDYFALGNEEADFRGLLNTLLSQMYTQTMMLLRSCEIDYDNPPDASKSLVAVNGVPLGTQDNLFCITGGRVRVRVTMSQRFLLEPSLSSA